MQEGVRDQWPPKVNISANSSHSKLSWARGRSPGWTAFDLKHKEKQGVEPELETLPYPPILNTITSVPTLKNKISNNSSSAKSFLSVVHPSKQVPFLAANSIYPGRQVIVGDSSKIKEKIYVVPALEKLKQLHSWADDSLIEDVLGAVNNDVDQASTLLNSMVFSGTSKEARIIKLAEERFLPDNSLFDNKAAHAGEDFPSENTTDLAGQWSASEKSICDKKIEETGPGTAIKTDLCDRTRHVRIVSQNLTTAPVEPEWEEDDVYLSHRRDAIRMIRSAAQHSRAANNAFIRGDHFSAQKLSLKAREEWAMAEKLNFVAAQDILKIVNSINDIWKLDLHGLHASEAVHALKERLWEIETQTGLDRPVSPTRIVKPQTDIIPISMESVNCLGKERVLSSERPTVLQVITGTGNHSRGQASLPVVVRSFLFENRYRFDEARPGVFAVRPKVRYR